MTKHGRPVAMLAPLPESTGEHPLAGLIAAGRLRPAVHDSRRVPTPVVAGANSTTSGLKAAATCRWSPCQARLRVVDGESADEPGPALPEAVAAGA